MDKVMEGAMRRVDSYPPITSMKEGQILRLHVSGDFGAMEGDGLDHDYINCVESELILHEAQMDRVPDVFGYTHMWRKHRLRDLRHHMHLHASVDTMEEAGEAIGEGWTIALTHPGINLKTGYTMVGKERLLVCPEQRGTVNNCEECKFCWNMPPAWAGVAFKEKS
jgi:hypothetical protein